MSLPQPIDVEQMTRRSKRMKDQSKLEYADTPTIEKVQEIVVQNEIQAVEPKKKQKKSKRVLLEGARLVVQKISVASVPTYQVSQESAFIKKKSVPNYSHQVFYTTLQYLFEQKLLIDYTHNLDYYFR